MSKFLKIFILILSFVAVNTRAIAQQQIVGKPITGIKGITKSVAEIAAFSKQQELLKPPSIEAPRPELEMPDEIPLPGEKIITYGDATINNGNVSARIVAATQQIHSNFMATDFSSASGGWPPDNNGDVGTTQVFIAQNFRLVVYPKPSVTAAAVTTPNGTSTTLLASPVLNVSQNTFFRTAFASVNTTDPHVRYDRLTNRWFVISMSTNEATNNYLLFAVSSGATISNTSSFTFFRIALSSFPAGNADIGKFLDYPTLGIDKFSLYLGANIFTTSTGSSSHSSIYVVNKADMIAGILTITAFPAVGLGVGSGADIRTPQGVQNDDPNATEGYFIGSSVYFSQLILRKITYSGTTPILNAQSTITISTNRSPIGQPASGSSGTLDASNTRLFAAMMMKNKITGVSTLWTAQTVGAISNGTSSTGTNDRNGSRWYEIQNLSTTPVVKQSGTLFNAAATNPRGFWFPSIAMSGQGHSIMAVSSASAVDRIDIVIAGRYSSSLIGDLEDSVYATATTSDYNPISGSFINRWGDYSQVVVDPQDNMTMWAFHQYTNTTNSYGVRAIQLKAPAPPATNVTAAPSGFCSASAAVTITGTTVDNTGFFDPGADVGGPGFNRLSITCSGGVAVSNVAFISPTQVSCTVNTVGKTAGIYTLTITNPDGQATTATFTLSSACVVPVRLLAFDGLLEKENVVLKWKTTQELNFSRFIVEKSFDGIDFLEIGTVNALGGSAENLYGLVDRSVYPGNNYYRLKMVDVDGSFRYSEIINIKTPLKSITVTRVYPNPASDIINIEFISEKTAYIHINLYASNGSRVIAINKKNGIGLNKSVVSCKGLSKAIYLLIVTDNEGNEIYKKSIAVK